MLDTLSSDIRYAARSLARRPLVTAVAVLSLALGVGVNTAMFSVFNRILLEQLAVPSPDALVTLSSPGPRAGDVSNNDSGDSQHVFNHPLFRDLERMQTVFTDIGGFREIEANLAYRGQTASAEGLLVSGGYFPALRVQPALGRLLTHDDDREGGAADVVVLSHRYWVNRFAASAAVLNDTLIVNNVPMTIVGVAPPGFYGTTKMENERFFVPLRLAPRISRWRAADNRREWWIYVTARLKPGLSMAQAAAQMQPPFSPLVRDLEYPAQESGLSEKARAAVLARRLVLEPGSRGQNGNEEEEQTIFALLFTITGFVLLIACANVANLLMARATERAAEVAVRLAVGASGWSVFRLLFVESALLALLGGAGSLVVARATMVALLGLLPVEDGEVLAFALDVPVLLFTAAASMATALLFGVAPAVHAVRARAANPATSGRSTATRATARMRASLAGSQVALATALLAVSGLLILSLANLTQVDLGLRRDGLSLFRISPILNGYTPPRTVTLYSQIEAALQQTPGVVSVSGATVRLLDDSSSQSSITVTGFTAGPDDNTSASYTHIGSHYFATLGIPLVAGREFTDADASDARPVAIVNEAFVRKFRLGRNALGARLGTTRGRAPDIDIVGVVADSTYHKARETPPPQYFRPYRQTAAPTLSFYVRTAPGIDPSGLMTSIPGLVHRFDPNLPVDALRTMDQQFDENTTSERVVMTLASALAMLATLLAGIGLYAVLAYSVSQRVREIGIRMALGARSANVQMMVLGQSSRIAIVATIVGVTLAVALGWIGQAMLFGVTAIDVRAQGGAAALMLAVALIAGALPARRAAAVNPVEALRAD
ncbi:MAG TPA: ABC transporter permease [Vicinamibacterales bacterium]|jgi:predicted permease|nr:ABC transporter permease [Vicinamibacterales bacterium]